MIVHLASTNDIGSRAAVEAPARHPDGTWNIKLTVAVFRPWRSSQATIASDPAFDAAPRFAHPHRRLGEEFDPAIAGCWCREPLPPRLARPNYGPALRAEIQQTGADGPERFRGRPAPNLRMQVRSCSTLIPKIWSQRSDSNRRPAVYETAALPTELRWHILPLQPLLDIRAAFFLLECPLDLSSGCQTPKSFPTLHPHRQHPECRMHVSGSVLIIPANQMIGRTNVITPIASRLQHVNVTTHRTGQPAPRAQRAFGAELHRRKLCRVIMPRLRLRASKSTQTRATGSETNTGGFAAILSKSAGKELTEFSKTR